MLNDKEIILIRELLENNEIHDESIEYYNNLLSSETANELFNKVNDIYVEKKLYGVQNEKQES